MKSGMAHSGELITGLDYLKQRIFDVINTPLGSIVGRRNFGSRFHELVDHNINDEFYMDAYIRLADALGNPDNGLDDFKLNDMVIKIPNQNHIEIVVDGQTIPDLKTVSIDGISYELH